MHALPSVPVSPGAAAAPWLACLLDACLVGVAATAWTMGYGASAAAAVTGWGMTGVAIAAALAIAVALGYAAVRRGFMELTRHMIDRELEIDRLVATFHALRFPPERYYDDLPNYLCRVLHDPASVPLARRFAAQALADIDPQRGRSRIAAASRARLLDSAVTLYLADEAKSPRIVAAHTAANV